MKTILLALCLFFTSCVAYTGLRLKNNVSVLVYAQKGRFTHRVELALKNNNSRLVRMRVVCDWSMTSNGEEPVPNVFRVDIPAHSKKIIVFKKPAGMLNLEGECRYYDFDRYY